MSKYEYEAGTEVFVWDINKVPLGEGVLLYDYDANDDDNPMPEIRMDDGTLILGCDCWWMAMEEKKKADEEIRRKNER